MAAVLDVHADDDRSATDLTTAKSCNSQKRRLARSQTGLLLARALRIASEAAAYVFDQVVEVADGVTPDGRVAVEAPVDLAPVLGADCRTAVCRDRHAALRQLVQNLLLGAAAPGERDG